MAQKLTPDNYMILDMESGNAVAFYDSEVDAVRSFQTAIKERPEEAAELMLIAYDKHGNALWRTSGFFPVDQPQESSASA